MKLPIIKSIRNMLTEQLDNLMALGQALNRNLGYGSLVDLRNQLESEDAVAMFNVANGTTARQQTLQDVAKLMKGMGDLPGHVLKYSQVVNKGTPSQVHSLHSNRIYQLELLRVLLMTDRGLNREGYVDDLNAVIHQQIMRFTIEDYSPMSVALGLRDYVTLRCYAVVRSGSIVVEQFVCPSESIDHEIKSHDPNNQVGYNTEAIFKDFFSDTFHQFYPECEFDIGSYRKRFMEATDIPVSRTIHVYIGSKNEKGQFHETRYEMNRRMMYDHVPNPEPNGWPEKIQIEVMKNWIIESTSSDYNSRRNVGEHELLPYMLAAMAMDMPEENKFLVQYDAEDKCIMIIPGDPYVEPDTVAEVLPESGPAVSDRP